LGPEVASIKQYSALREHLKCFPYLVALVRIGRKGLRPVYSLTRFRAVRSYMHSHTIRKLQLGAGPYCLEGWLNTDLSPIRKRSIYLNATKRFPLENDTFDYVFSEHLIEHMTYLKGMEMLRECYRVLRPGGTIRIATPDLDMLIDLGKLKKSDMQKKYIKWITDTFLPGINTYKACFVINNAFRNYGHKFLYNGEVLQNVMEQVGFVDIERCSPGKSKDDHLDGIESHGKAEANSEMGRFETVVVEGHVPAKQ